ncbi:MFS transporter [Bacillus solitudinis]|uniref:MFS transporter n=1 Tax=Bacillus solitudinis TaxID=2014074 RepID=UPI000C247925|nr:MFS transporter [Bacillus solitudinis]
MANKKNWDVLSISSIPLVMTLGNSMLIPVLPIIEKKIAITAVQSSMLITVYSIVAILCIPVAGYISDHVGRKRVIIPSLILAGIGGLISGFAGWQMENPYSILLLGRLLQGIGAAGAAPIVLPLVGDLFTNEKEISKGLGIIETANTFGKVLSPILGALLAAIVWYMPFIAIPIFCFVSIVLLIFLVESPPQVEKPQPFKIFIKATKKVFKREGRWLYAVFIVGTICMFVLFGILFYLSTMLEETYQIKGVKKGIILAIPLAALCGSSFITGKTIGQDKQKMKTMTVIGIAFLTLATFSISFSEDIYILLTALFVSGIGIGFALPSLDAFVTEGIQKDQRGSITSFYSSMRFLGVALGPPIFAVMMKGSHFFLFFTNAFICLMALLITLFMIKPEETVKRTWG